MDEVPAAHRRYFIPHQSVLGLREVARVLGEQGSIKGQRRADLSEDFFLALQWTEPVDAQILDEQILASGGITPQDHAALPVESRFWVAKQEQIGKLARISCYIDSGPMTGAARARISADVEQILGALGPVSPVDKDAAQDRHRSEMKRGRECAVIAAPSEEDSLREGLREALRPRSA